MVQKFFKQKRQGNNRQSSIGRQKQNLIIFGGVVVSILAATHIGNVMEQYRLERDSVPIIISEVEDDIKLDYHTSKREISAKISGISLLAEVKVADDRANVYERRDSAGNIKYKIRNIKYGDSEVVISVIDGRRRSNKTIKFHRQMKADYDAQELKKALTLKRAEESVKNAEQQPTDEYISHAKSDIDKLPNDRRRAVLSERIAKLDKVKQEEKERAEKARQEAEDEKRQEAAAAAVAEASRRQHARVRQPQSQPNPVTVPAPTELHFHNCKEARAAGYGHIHRGQPGYAPHLDRDGDGIACDKHR